MFWKVFNSTMYGVQLLGSSGCQHDSTFPEVHVATPGELRAVKNMHENYIFLL